MQKCNPHLKDNLHRIFLIINSCLVFVAEVAAALLPTASECWLWEVEVDALLHWEGTMVGQAGQEANLEAVQGQCVMEIYLLCTIKHIHRVIRWNFDHFIYFYDQIKISF